MPASEAQKAAHKRFREKNPEKWRDWAGRYRGNNLEKARARGRRSYGADPEKSRSEDRRRYVLRTYGLTMEQVKQRKEDQMYRCAICGHEGPEEDDSRCWGKPMMTRSLCRTPSGISTYTTRRRLTK